MQFSVSYPVPVLKAHMVGWINDKKYWQPALDQAGEERADAWVVNATEVLGLTDYPEGTNLYLRAEPLHPGAQADLAGCGRAPDHRVFDELTALARTHPRCPAPGPGPV